MRALFGFVFVATLSACSTQTFTPARDESLAAALVGVWCNSEDGGKSCWAFDEFSAAGYFRACGKHEDERYGFSGGGKFTVNGQRMCYVVDNATPNFWLGVGGTYCTDILLIGTERHRYRDIDTKREFELIRVPATRKYCPATR